MFDLTGIERETLELLRELSAKLDRFYDELGERLDRIQGKTGARR